MKAIRWHQLATVVPIVFVSFLISGALGALTTTPSNAVGLLQDAVTFECATDLPSSIRWSYDSVIVSGDQCSWSSDNFVTANRSSTECYLMVQPTTSRLSGPYSCSDGILPNAQAVLITIDPEPTCGVSSLPVVQGETVTLSCSMTYYFQSPQARLPPGAQMSATISWESGAGTQTTPDPIDHTIASGALVGHTIQVDAQRTVTETELPSYTCTTTFSFTDQTDPLYSFALNSVSWTCTSAAILSFYCPTMATVTPFSEPFTEGDVLTCTYDGYPEPTLQWTDSTGTVVSTTNTMTLTAGAFSLTCTATGNFTTPCSASTTVSGVAAMTTMTTNTASTTTTTANTGTFTTQTPGTGTTTVGTGTTTTRAPYTGTGTTVDTAVTGTATTSNTTDTGATTGDNLNTILTIVFSILIGLGLFWMLLLLCCWPALTAGRRRRRRRRERRGWRRWWWWPWWWRYYYPRTYSPYYYQ